jgi:hypothetical protein
MRLLPLAALRRDREHLSLPVCGCQGLLPTVSKETRVLSLYLSVDARVSKFNKAKVLSQPVRECQGQ